MLFNEPKLLKWKSAPTNDIGFRVSVLFNEPKLLKYCQALRRVDDGLRFSALQRAEIAEMLFGQRPRESLARFSALQRAEIAEIILRDACAEVPQQVSVLFNEPKLLKFQ